MFLYKYSPYIKIALPIEYGNECCVPVYVYPKQFLLYVFFLMCPVYFTLNELNYEAMENFHD